jgi:glutamate synthase (NADPH/NADH) small chain
MKLEKKIVERRVSLMAAEGVKFVTGADVGKTVSPESILAEFDAVILCCGASNPRDLPVPGRDSKGVYFAVDFLKATTRSLLNSRLQDKNFISAKDKKVVVVGGGDTGNDCVGTSIRHGCASIVQIEMLPKPPAERAANNPWPEWPRTLKTDYGQEEAIFLFGKDPRVFQTTVKEMIPDEKGNLKAIKIVKLEPKRDEATGRMSMVEIPGSEEIIDCDLLLIAAGFLGTQNYIAEAFGVERDGRTNVKTEAGHHRTSADKVFTAGDMHRGQSLVVWAITEGRSAAREVDEYLMGYTNLD